METLKVDLEKLKRPNWTSEEHANADLVRDFIQHLMNDHDIEYVLKNFDQGSYIQHNRSMPNGVKGVVDYVSKFVKQFPEYTYDVKHMYVDGDYVTIQSHVTTKKKDRGNPQKGFNIIDTWKIKDGRLVEHWDAIQPINGFMRFYSWMVGGKTVNENTLF
ncbi:nuclear transport factor 2 family protein [Sanyastnella coralliicola]|uniref:nuclear transport factor 2 family protein n=1 Tax=Sanyastnella coralliicola TaxID=3069118 RepID=UPI0027B933A1|nr:nuclear transport factor 2 family protein [Longitalea sp. SCSIO 12813]